MNFYSCIQVLAVDRSRMFRNMGNGFREKQENFNPAQLLVWALMLVTLFIVLNILSRAMAKRDKQPARVPKSPRALFLALCRVHALDRPSRRLLKLLAAQYRLQQPAQIFLEPDCFNTSDLSPALRAYATALVALQRKLFGSPQRSTNQLPVDQEAVEIARETSRLNASSHSPSEIEAPPILAAETPKALSPLPIELDLPQGLPLSNPPDVVI